jgi:hypothetical protein
MANKISQSENLKKKHKHKTASNIFTKKWLWNLPYSLTAININCWYQQNPYQRIILNLYVTLISQQEKVIMYYRNVNIILLI